MPAIKILSKVNNDTSFISQRRVYPRVDGWNNLFTGMGTLHDKRMSTTFSAKSFMNEMELSDLYVDDGIAKRIVDIIPDEMLKKGFEIEGDEASLVQSTLEELGALHEIEMSLKWNRLFGGAVCVMGIDDGGKLDTPLNETIIRTLDFLRVYDRFRVQWTSNDLYIDPEEKKYGKVQWYTIYPVGSYGVNSGFRVHESRCLVLSGVSIPDQARQLNQGWGASYLQHCYDQIRDLNDVYGGLGHIVQDFVFGTLTIQNLQELMAAGKEQLVKDRLELMDLSRHMINTLLLDERETYTKHASTVSGLAEIVEKFVQAVCMVTGIPMRKLIGQQGGGLNNEGKGESDDFFDMIQENQQKDLKPLLERLTKIIMLSKDGYFKGIEPEDWKIKFNPLKQTSETEDATVKKTNAEADCAYVNAGVLDAAEVAESRFGGDTYGKQIVLSIGVREPMPMKDKISLSKDKNKEEKGIEIKGKKNVK